ncbi:LysR substrate-binding domain-containing protein, partial [Klebsiella pneumoniae]
VLLADALASGSLVRVLEAWTPQPRPVHLLWRQDRRPLPKLTQFIAHLQQGMADALPMTRASE